VTVRPAVPFVVAAVVVGAATAGALCRWAAVSSPVWLWLAAVNVGTAAMYAYDKAAARWRVRRVPEMVLHGLTLLGGTPAALLHQRILRHKTQKTSFRRWFAAILVVQAAIIAVLLRR